MSTREFLQLRCTLERTAKPVWRLLILDPRLTLGQLHTALQFAFGWNNSHLHLFRSDDGHIYSLPKMLEEEFSDERKALLHELFTASGVKLLYNYDFGDDWMVTIQAQDLVDPEKIKYNPLTFIEAGRGVFTHKPRAAMCSNGRGAQVPDDCGGPFGYDALLDAVATPPGRRSQHQALLVEWIASTDEFWRSGDPNFSWINQQMAKIRVKKSNLNSGSPD